MFNFDLVLSKKSNEQRVYLTLPPYFYVVFSIISALILLGITFYEYSILSVVLLIISITALTFRESWDFDNNTKSLTVKFGIGFIYPKKVYKFNEIELLEYITFVRGQQGNKDISKKDSFFLKKYHSIKLHYSDGKSATILSISDRYKDKINLITEEIIRVTGVKLEKPM